MPMLSVKDDNGNDHITRNVNKTFDGLSEGC